MAKEYNLIELCEAHFFLVEKDFDLNKSNDEMLDVDWEPIKHHLFFTAEKLLKFCQENNDHINETYWGKQY